MSSKGLLIRHTRRDVLPPLIALQTQTYPEIPPWSESRFLHQLDVFPQGQLTAEIDGEIVGCASGLVVLWDDWPVEHTWKEITASGTFATHNPAGRTFYGAEVFVDPNLRGYGLGHALYEARRELCRRMNLKRIIACGRLPGYLKHSGEMSADLYAMKVVWGDLNDPVLGFQLREGFRFCTVIADYLPEDKESCGNASLIVWLNPDFDASQPTLIPEGDVL
jgi:GNAT superfamily N-acetyltransferase